MNKLDLDYQNLLKDILENGVKKETRNGGTISVFGRQIRHNMKDGFPLLTTKKMPFKTIVTELLWFLRGDTNIKYLVDNNCHIWNGDAYKNYLNVVMFEKPGYFHEKHGHLNMSVKKEGDNYLPLTQEEFINRIKTDNKFTHWGDLGKIYGSQWRNWEYQYGDEYTDGHYLESSKKKIDQIQNLINDLKTNPDSRRLMVNAWNVGELDKMVLPPCHYGFQVYTRELSAQERLEWVKVNLPNIDMNGFVNNDEYSHKWVETLSDNIPTRAISLMWNQRSVDTFLGLPFNIASYGLLLEIIAKEVNMVPDQLIGNLGDVHLYSNHIEQAKEQIGRELTLDERFELWGNKENESAMFTYNNFSSVPERTKEPFGLPTLNINPNNKMRIGGGIFTYDKIDFEIENYQSHPTIKAPLSN